MHSVSYVCSINWPEHGAYIRRYLRNRCARKAGSLLFDLRAQHLLRYHLIKVTWVRICFITFSTDFGKDNSYMQHEKGPPPDTNVSYIL